MLTEQELQKVFSWLPYRQDWPVDTSQNDDSIDLYYGDLIKSLTQNRLFDTFYSEDGGLGNYLEFICYPVGHKTYEGNAILVCVSLCSPVASYGQTTLSKGVDFIGWGNLFSPEKAGLISDNSLTEIEKEIKGVLTTQRLTLLDKEFAGRPLPDDVAENLTLENHNKGSQYLHGIFQKTD
jgi:hypothetical protein